MVEERSSRAAAEPVPVVPAEEQPLDPRAIGRASLAAGRNASLWWVLAGLAVVLVVAMVAGTRAGAWTLAGALAAAAVARGALPSPGPVALSVRSKPIDMTMLAGFAVALGALAQLLPSR